MEFNKLENKKSPLRGQSQKNTTLNDTHSLPFKFFLLHLGEKKFPIHRRYPRMVNRCPLSYFKMSRS